MSQPKPANAHDAIDYLDNIKPVIRALKPYALALNDAPIKLNQNENPFDFPHAIKQEVARRFTSYEWTRYPDFVPTRLQESLGRYAGWTSDGVIVGNGSNEIINALFTVTIAKGEKVLLSEPTFAIFRQGATVLDADILSVPLDANLNHDTQSIRREIETHQPVVTVICSPNNPTGCVMSRGDLVELLEAARGFVVVDEAYWEFEGATVAGLLSEHKNLIVLRTFSKALGLAALRIGYLLAAPQVASEIRKAVLPYNINRFSNLVAQVALEMYDAELKPLVAEILSERNRLFAEVSNIAGITPHATHANFFVARTEQISPRELYDELLKREILIRDVSKQKMLESYARISVGTREENDKLIAALREIYA